MFYKKGIFVISIFVFSFLIVISNHQAQAQTKPTLTVEKIMQDPKWIGVSPRSQYWSEDGKWIYFMWNPENATSDSLYKVSNKGGTPQKVSLAERKAMPSRFGTYNNKKTEKLYAKNGDIFLLQVRNGKIQQITNTVESESNPRFSMDESKIIYQKQNNLYVWNRKSGETDQLTNFKKGKKKSPDKPKNEQEKWLVEQQKALMKVVTERKERSDISRENRKLLNPDRPKEIYIESKSIQNIQLSPDGNVVTFRLVKQPRDAKRTIVPNYVTDSGFTEDLNARVKVGSAQASYELGIYNIEADTVFYISTKDVPGIYDKPAYRKEYEKEKQGKEEEKEAKKAKKKPRGVIFHGPYFSEDGKHAVVLLRAQDNKDRWITLLNVVDGSLKLLDRQHDDAWIAGPGIGWSFGAGSLGWLPDNRRFWFQSEEAGYSHLYTVDVVSGAKVQLTKGKFEVFNPQISKDKKNWYFTSSEVHPGERHLYKMSINGGKAIKLTSMTGSNQTRLSPDEKQILIRFSYSNRPNELFVTDNKPNAKAKQLTSSLREEFTAYPWRDPELVKFKARDGVEVPARLYRPENPQKNGPAVIFVHGAGYLQNVHKWWSSYFREYMFHNLLADNGYTVLDIDYRGSAGYGRDWRTAIYQFMGGNDLTDQVDGAKFLVDEYDVDPKRIGIYGGSYGGFITFMALFTTPDVFAAGAALRPVSDWAHYNHPYTSNILNTPVLDSLAYVRSSPIYHAEGLKGQLLICVGMVDTNVHFQDVVRLVQRLIELGKDNFETAIYPVEAHGFREPSSWTDEYKRIFKLFEENLK